MSEAPSSIGLTVDDALIRRLAADVDELRREVDALKKREVLRVQNPGTTISPPSALIGGE